MVGPDHRSRLHRGPGQGLKKHGINVSGEGGEYETMALDSPMHAQPIRVEATESVVERDSARLLVKKCSLDFV